jgi:SAM-dependent methyltransferase
MTEHSFLDANYWRNRYQSDETGWDLGAVSSPLKTFIDQLTNKEILILIPGSGRAYEAEYLFLHGFTNVHVLDFVAEPLVELKNRCPQIPENQLHVGDFFDFSGKFDLIIEQTLFCALDPKLRPDYAKKCAELLKEGGILAGLLFNRTFESGPPFGGNKEEYLSLFSPYFSKIQMEECYNSLPARAGSELFVLLGK